MTSRQALTDINTHYIVAVTKVLSSSDLQLTRCSKHSKHSDI